MLVLLGVLLTPALITVIAPGFSGAKRDLDLSGPHSARRRPSGAVRLCPSAFSTATIVFFFLRRSCAVERAMIIATLIFWGARTPLPQLAMTLAWGSVIGSAMQFLVQLPVVVRLVPGLRLRPDISEHVRTTVRNFGRSS